MNSPTLGVPLEAALVLELAGFIQSRQLALNISSAVALAVRRWMASDMPASVTPIGYQWRQLFLPDGTMLRITRRGEQRFAKVAGSQLLYDGITTTPTAFGALASGYNKNAWRAVFICWPGEKQWRLASRCRREALAALRCLA